MEQTLTVRVKVEPVNGKWTPAFSTSPAENVNLRQSIREAVVNALHHAEDEGFVHPLEAEISIEVLSVQIDVPK